MTFRDIFLTLFFFFLAALFNVSSAQETKKFERKNCPIQLTHPLSLDVQTNCELIEYDNNAKVNWAIFDSPDIVIFGLNKLAPKGLYHRFSGQTKIDTKKFLFEFGYIKENWKNIGSIRGSKKAFHLESGEKVIGYKVSLTTLDTCIGFAKGIAGNVSLTGGGVGAERIAVGLACDVKNQLGQEILIEVLETFSFGELRY